MDLDVFIGDVVNHATLSWSYHAMLVRIVLDVNAFEWMEHFAVLESHVAHTRLQRFAMG